MPKSCCLFTTMLLGCWLSLLLVLSAGGRLFGQATIEPLLQHARNYEAQQNFAAAEDQYKQALEISPGSPEVLKRLGILYQTELKLQVSLEAFAKVLASQPQYPETNFFMGA